MSTKKSNYTIGNGTRDLPACSAVPQPTALPRAPKLGIVSYQTSGIEQRNNRLASEFAPIHTRGFDTVHLLFVDMDMSNARLVRTASLTS
jgi:hypothetical protein